MRLHKNMGGIGKFFKKLSKKLFKRGQHPEGAGGVGKIYNFTMKGKVKPSKRRMSIHNQALQSTKVK